MRRRQFIPGIGAVLLLWTAVFAAARIWDARHPPKYATASLNDLTDDRYFSRELEGKRITVWGEVYERSWSDPYLVERAGGEHPTLAHVLKLQMPPNVALPPVTSPTTWVSGVLHVEPKDPTANYVLRVEQGEYRYRSVTDDVESWSLTILLITMSAAVAALAYRSERHRWRRKLKPAGHCVDCGYDLRASSERCPECGAPTHKAQTFASKSLE